MKFTAILLFLALFTFSSVASAGYPPRRYSCSNRCYRWRPSRCSRYCRPRRTTCRMSVKVRRCRYVYRRKWDRKVKVCKIVRKYRERRAWKCMPRRRYRPTPPYYPPHGGSGRRCMDKCMAWWSQAKRGCNRRYCRMERCNRTWPKAHYGKLGWGCFSKRGGHGGYVPPPPPHRPPYYPATMAPTTTPPFFACYTGCRRLHMVRPRCNYKYCTVRPCKDGKFMCLPKLKMTTTVPATTTAAPATTVTTKAGSTTTTLVAPTTMMTTTTSTGVKKCGGTCFREKNRAIVVKTCDLTYCKVVTCTAKIQGYTGVGCIEKA